MVQNKRQIIQVRHQIEETLNAFRSDPGLPHDPWFFEKLQNRMRETQRSPGRNEMSLYERLLRPALLVSLVAFNILAVVWALDMEQPERNGSTNYIDNLADEYGLNIADTYLLENGNGNGGEH